MKVSIGVPGLCRYGAVHEPWMDSLRAPDFQRICRRLEAIGFDCLDTPEHLALDVAWVDIMGGVWPHAVAAMAFFAGATTTIRVNSSVLILPLHQPVNLAKAMSTLDVLSGGRAMLSVGLGHGEAEFRALGVPWKQRGRIADEYLQALDVLWTHERPEFAGQYVSFDSIVFEPRPLQRPFPLWIGGNSEFALRRAVRFGTGWRPWQVVLEDLPAWKDKLDRLMEEFGRTTPLDLHLLAAPLGVGADHRQTSDGAKPKPLGSAELADRLHRMEALGVNWTSLSLLPARSLDECLDLMEETYAPLIAQLH